MWCVRPWSDLQGNAGSFRELGKPFELAFGKRRRIDCALAQERPCLARETLVAGEHFEREQSPPVEVVDMVRGERVHGRTPCAKRRLRVTAVTLENRSVLR